MGAAGQVIMFFMFMIAQIMLGIFVLAYAAHCLLVVVENTAAGNDEVAWPDELLLDWAWKVFCLIWLYGIWLLPIWLVVKASKPTVLLENPGPTFIAVASAIYWLLFPISLLSSLSAASPWVPLSWQLLRRLIRQAPAAAVFYVSSGLLLAGSAWLVSKALFSNSFVWVPVAALTGAAAFLIVCRLL